MIVVRRHGCRHFGPVLSAGATTKSAFTPNRYPLFVSFVSFKNEIGKSLIPNPLAADVGKRSGLVGMLTADTM